MTDPSFGLDLSYLTTDERRIIDDVLRRQKEEEERNASILRGLQDDYDRIAQAVRYRIASDILEDEQPPELNAVTIPNGSSTCFSATTEAEAALMCQICRTHIPDIPIEGIRLAHCHYCGLRVCYRCGTILTYKAKTVWTCALCRKRHELLVKTGQWASTASEFDAGFTATAASRRAHTRSRSQEPRPLVITTPSHVSRVVHGQIVPLPGQPLDLRRHISSSSAQIDSACDVDVSAEWTSPDVTQQYNNSSYSPKPHFASPTATNFEEQHPSWLDSNITVAEQRRPNSTIAFNHHTAGFLRSSADRASSTLPRQGSLRAAQSLSRLSLSNLHHLPSFKTISSSNKPVVIGGSEGRSPPPMLPHNRSEASFHRHGLVHDTTSCSVSNNASPATVLIANGRTASSSSISHNNPSSAPVFNVGRSVLRRSRLAAMGHQDSLSSDPSSDFGGGMAHSSSSASYINASPNILQQTLHRNSRRSFYAQMPQTSISSSEDDTGSTPDYLTESDLEFEVESASVSERGDIDSYRSTGPPEPSGGGAAADGWRHGGTLPLGAMSGSGVVDPLTTCGANFSPQTHPSPSHGLSATSQRMKAVRFQRGGSVDCAFPGTRDSGMETASSTQTLNEDGSKFRMDWQKSPDGTKLVGKFSILRNNRSESSSRILGLKVVGGRLTDNGQLGAIVTKVKLGSVADTIGRLRPGDEVIEWNGVHLKGLSFEQVYEVISSARDSRRLELVVHRCLLWRLSDEMERIPDAHSRTPTLSVRRHSVTFNTSTSMLQQLTSQFSQPETEMDAGRLQLKLWLDTVRSELAVTVVSARDLLPIGVSNITTEPPPHAFCVITLLPNEKDSDLSNISNTGGSANSTPQKGSPSRRWTNRHPPSWEPRWDQVFSLWPVSAPSNVSLDAAVYDAQPPDGCCESESSFARCIGCVALRLSEVPLTNEAYWYRLTKPEPGSRSGPGIIPPLMSVPSHSNSEMSAISAAANVIVPRSTVQTQQKKQSPKIVAQAVVPPSTTTWQQGQVQQQQMNVGMGQQLVPQQVQQPQMYVDPLTGQQVIQPMVPCWSMPSDQAFQQMFGQQGTMMQQQQQPGLSMDANQPQMQSWTMPDGTSMMMPQQQMGMVQPSVMMDPNSQMMMMGQTWTDVTMQQQQQLQMDMIQQQQQQQQQQQPMFQPTTMMMDPQQQQMMQPPQQSWTMPSIATDNMTAMFPQQQQQFLPGQQISASVTIHQQGTTLMEPSTLMQQPFATQMTPIMPTMMNEPMQPSYIPQQPAPVQPLPQPTPVTPAPAPLPVVPPPVSQAAPIPVTLALPPLIAKQPEIASSPPPKHPSSSGSRDNLQGGVESEPEYGMLGDDPSGRLYRKQSQTGIATSTPQTSLGRRVARHRSDVSNMTVGSNNSLASSEQDTQPPAPPVEPTVPPSLPTSTSSSSQLQSAAAANTTESGDKSKRHVRLAPEVSFIIGNDEPPISMPLASESVSSLVDAPDRDLASKKPTSDAGATMHDTATKPGVSALRRGTLAGSESSMTRVGSIGETSTASDAESAISGTEQASEGEMGSRSTIHKQSSLSESETAGGYSSGGEHGDHGSGKESDGGHTDPAVLAARLQKKSLWGSAAKKSLIKLTGKSAFPSVVDSVIAANAAKGKKKAGINRCGDEVQITAPSGGGFDMSAGFFDGDLGPGQVVGRQMLGATAIGELEMGFREDGSGHLTVTLVAARDLLFKHKSPPAIYAKSALVVGQSTQERQKSVPQQVRDCDPQLGIEFPFQTSPFRDKMLQVSLWAAYGKMSGRHCLGAVAVKLEEIKQLPLRASYKLYDPSAVGGFVAAIASEGPAVALM